jgi:hypothetical protein
MERNLNSIRVVKYVIGLLKSANISWINFCIIKITYAGGTLC